jgi:site-specific recombinase XerD
VSRSQFWRRVERYAKAADIPEHEAHPHVLKHSIAMQTIGSAGIENVRQQESIDVRSVRRMLLQITKLRGLPPMHPHLLRHACATCSTMHALST